MSLKDYRNDLEMCCRCSACKFIPLEKVKSTRSYVCPSIARYNFHAYSGGGRVAASIAILEDRIAFSDKLKEIIYNCQMCGACDTSCKYAMDMEVLEPLYELRMRCVDEGHTHSALDGAIHNLQKQSHMVLKPAAKRGEWAQGFNVKDYLREKTGVAYHVGCRTSFDKELWKVARASLSLLQKAGVDVGIAGKNEICCGGRAYQMGYKQDFLGQAKKNVELFKRSGVKTLVTGCAECYHSFKVLYDKFDMKGNLEVLHTSEYFARLVKEGTLKPHKKVVAKVTYHDPCHLGRLGEPYIHWKGTQIPGHIRLFDPPREFMRGTYGVYAAPRDVLKSIPGIKLIEMDRINEYAWCCGAGGGVKETNPEFAGWTAEQRIEEAESTGAEAIVTACPGCEKSFNDTIKDKGNTMKVYDLAELLDKATQKGGR
jgi:Fe-S oxidoreductase